MAHKWLETSSSSSADVEFAHENADLNMRYLKGGVKLIGGQAGNGYMKELGKNRAFLVSDIIASFVLMLRAINNIHKTSGEPESQAYNAAGFVVCCLVFGVCIGVAIGGQMQQGCAAGDGNICFSCRGSMLVIVLVCFMILLYELTVEYDSDFCTGWGAATTVIIAGIAQTILGIRAFCANHFTSDEKGPDGNQYINALANFIEGVLLTVAGIIQGNAYGTVDHKNGWIAYYVVRILRAAFVLWRQGNKAWGDCSKSFCTNPAEGENDP